MKIEKKRRCVELRQIHRGVPTLPRLPGRTGLRVHL